MLPLRCTRTNTTVALDHRAGQRSRLRPIPDPLDADRHHLDAEMRSGRLQNRLELAIRCVIGQKFALDVDDARQGVFEPELVAVPEPTKVGEQLRRSRELRRQLCRSHSRRT